MGTGLALLTLVAAAAGAVATWLVRARRSARQVRRRDALAGVAGRVDAALETLRSSPVPVPRRGPSPSARGETPAGRGAAHPGRAALIDALRDAVEATSAEGSRLAAAVIESDAELDDDVRRSLAETAAAPVYLVGPRAAGLVLPGLGRAAALGVLARIQAAHGLEGRVVELEQGESAVELTVRLLGRDAGQSEGRDASRPSV